MECKNTESGFDVKICNSPADTVGRTIEKVKTPSASSSKSSPKVMNATAKTRSQRSVKSSPARPTLTHSAPLRTRSAQTPKSTESRLTTGTPGITQTQTSSPKTKPNTTSQGKPTHDSKTLSARKTLIASTAIVSKPSKTQVSGVAVKPQTVASTLQPARESKAPKSVKQDVKVSSSKEITEPLRGKMDTVKAKSNSSSAAKSRPTVAAAAAKRSDKSMALKANEARSSKSVGSKTSQSPSTLDKSKENARVVKKKVIQSSVAPSWKALAINATSTPTKLKLAKVKPQVKATGRLSATKAASAGKGLSATVAKPKEEGTTEIAKKSPKTTAAGAARNEQISSVTTLSDLACKALPLMSELSSSEAAKLDCEYEVSVAPYEATGALLSPASQVPRPVDGTPTDLHSIAVGKVIVEVNAAKEDDLMDTVVATGQRDIAVSSAIDDSVRRLEDSSVRIAEESAAYEQIKNQGPHNAGIGIESDLDGDETQTYKEAAIPNKATGLENECSERPSFYPIHKNGLTMERLLIEDGTQVIRLTDACKHQTPMMLHGEEFSQLSTDANRLEGDVLQPHHESLSSVEKIKNQGEKVVEGTADCQEDADSTLSQLAMADGVIENDFSQWAAAPELNEVVSDQKAPMPGNDYHSINFSSSQSDDFEVRSSHNVSIRERSEASEELGLESSDLEFEIKPRSVESWQHPDSCQPDEYEDSLSTSKEVSDFQKISSFEVGKTDSMESMRPIVDHEFLSYASEIGKGEHGGKEVRLGRGEYEISFDGYVEDSVCKTSDKSTNADDFDGITIETERRRETEKSSRDNSALDGVEDNQPFCLATGTQESYDCAPNQNIEQFFDKAKGKGIENGHSGSEVLFKQLQQSNDESFDALNTEEQHATARGLPDLTQGTNEMVHVLHYNILGTPTHSRSDVVGVTFGDLPEPTYVGARKYDIDCDDMYRVTPLDDFRYDSDNLTPSDVQSPTASPVRLYRGECDFEPSQESVDLGYDLTKPVSDVGVECMTGSMAHVPIKGDGICDITACDEEDVRNVCIDFAYSSMQTESRSDQNESNYDRDKNHGLTESEECPLNTSDYEMTLERYEESGYHQETTSAFELNGLSLENHAVAVAVQPTKDSSGDLQNATGENYIEYQLDGSAERVHVQMEYESDDAAQSRRVQNVSGATLSRLGEIDIDSDDSPNAEDSSNLNKPTADQTVEQRSKPQQWCHTDVDRAAVQHTDGTEDPYLTRSDDPTSLFAHEDEDPDSQGAYDSEPSGLSTSEILSDTQVSQQDDGLRGANEFIVCKPIHVYVTSDSLHLGDSQEQQTTVQKFARKEERGAEDCNHGLVQDEDAEMNFEDREVCALTHENMCDSNGRQIHALSLDCISQSSTHQAGDYKDSCHSLPPGDRADVRPMGVGLLSSAEVDDGIIIDTETGNEVGQDIHYVDGRHAMGSFGSPTFIADVSSDSDIGEDTEPDEFPDEYTDGFASSVASSYASKQGEVEGTEGGRVANAGCGEEGEDELFGQTHAAQATVIQDSASYEAW